MTPLTTQGTTFQENGAPNTRTIMYGKFIDIKNYSRSQKNHLKAILILYFQNIFIFFIKK